MLFIDAHLDLGLNAIQYQRDLTHSVYTIRQEAPPSRLTAWNTVALPELRQGKVALCFATTLARNTGTPDQYFDFRSPMQAYAVANSHLAYYRALSQQGYTRVITAPAALAEHMAAWHAYDRGEQSGAPALGLVLSMESADPILEPDDLPEWYAAGIRLIGPAHYGPGRYAGGTGTELPLTERGRALLDNMQQLGIILDTTHFSDGAFWEALERYSGPLIASHNNCRALVPKQRQFSDAQLRALIERGGVIGVAFDAIMLLPGWITGQTSNANVTLELVVDQIDYICQLAGNSEHVAIGTDLDGGYGREQSPSDLDTIADLQKLPAMLAKRGYTTAQIAGICHGNWLRLLQAAWQ